jgi:hypothetical protein
VVSIATINAIDETNVPSSFRKCDLEAIQAALEEVASSSPTAMSPARS